MANWVYNTLKIDAPPATARDIFTVFKRAQDQHGNIVLSSRSTKSTFPQDVVASWYQGVPESKALGDSLGLDVLYSPHDVTIWQNRAVEVKFKTRWKPPTRFLRGLLRTYPDIRSVKCDYVEHDTCFAGRLSYNQEYSRKGEILDISEDIDEQDWMEEWRDHWSLDPNS